MEIKLERQNQQTMDSALQNFEKTLWENKAKAFIFEENEWRQYGRGSFKFLQQPDNEIRMFMHCEEQNKILLDSFIQENTEMFQKPKACVLKTQNSKDMHSASIVAIKFSNAETAQEFYNHFQKYKQQILIEPERSTKDDSNEYDVFNLSKTFLPILQEIYENSECSLREQPTPDAKIPEMQIISDTKTPERQSESKQETFLDLSDNNLTNTHSYGKCYFDSETNNFWNQKEYNLFTGKIKITKGSFIYDENVHNLQCQNWNSITRNLLKHQREEMNKFTTFEFIFENKPNNSYIKQKLENQNEILLPEDFQNGLSNRCLIAVKTNSPFFSLLTSTGANQKISQLLQTQTSIIQLTETFLMSQGTLLFPKRQIQTLKVKQEIYNILNVYLDRNGPEIHPNEIGVEWIEKVKAYRITFSTDLIKTFFEDLLNQTTPQFAFNLLCNGNFANWSREKEYLERLSDPMAASNSLVIKININRMNELERILKEIENKSKIIIKRDTIQFFANSLSTNPQFTTEIWTNQDSELPMERKDNCDSNTQDFSYSYWVNQPETNSPIRQNNNHQGSQNRQSTINHSRRRDKNITYRPRNERNQQNHQLNHRPKRMWKPVEQIEHKYHEEETKSTTQEANNRQTIRQVRTPSHINQVRVNSTRPRHLNHRHRKLTQHNRQNYLQRQTNQSTHPVQTRFSNRNDGTRKGHFQINYKQNHNSRPRPGDNSTRPLRYREQNRTCMETRIPMCGGPDPPPRL